MADDFNGRERRITIQYLNLPYLQTITTAAAEKPWYSTVTVYTEEVNQQKNL